MFTLRCTVFTLSPGHSLLNATLQQLYTKICSGAAPQLTLAVRLLTLQLSVQLTGKSAAKCRATASVGHLVKTVRVTH